MYENEELIPQETLDSLRMEAVTMAKDADVVIYIGGLNKNSYQDCEASDRREYNLPYGQDRLIEELAAANPNIIVANISGNAYAMPWLNKVPAVVQNWYLGTMGGPAMADMISGRTNPSGKLPFSFPKKLKDCGAHAFGEDVYPGIENPEPHQTYKEDILVGYRWHDTKKIPALFSFGHGLSYTNFSYGKPVISDNKMSKSETITVEIPITNKGDQIGSEIVQFYISDIKSSLLRPVKELKGFRKVRLMPGETATIKYEVTPEHLQFFDDTAHRWVAEPGKFELLIGASSTDIRRKVSFEYK